MGEKIPRGLPTEFRIDRDLPAELRNLFEEEFKNTSVFSFAYDHFSSVCLSFLSSAQDRIHTGWEQAYLLYYGKVG